jgi:hypothetical protein
MNLLNVIYNNADFIEALITLIVAVCLIVKFWRMADNIQRLTDKINPLIKNESEKKRRGGLVVFIIMVTAAIVLSIVIAMGKSFQ